jgi:hypothetical protein
MNHQDGDMKKKSESVNLNPRRLNSILGSAKLKW